MSRRLQLFTKRGLDVILCSLVVVCGLPILLLLGIIVKMSSTGPVFFLQERVGRNEKVYRIIKFRTMAGKPDERSTRWTAADELRITYLGRFMRDYGIDELPQLLNILKGDMSIVGPRTPLPQQLDSLSAYQKRMFQMRPGVLSLAAVSGRRSLTMEERYDLHAKYVDQWSLTLDFRILWLSLLVVLKKEAATETTVGG